MHCNRLTFAAFSILSLLVCGSAWAEGWTQFRGDFSRGVSGGGVPTTWSETENLAWKTDLPGKGSSSPVVVGDRVFLTAYSGYAQDAADPGDRSALTLHVICLSLESGKILWDRQVDPVAEEQDASKRVADHGYASPTPCADEKNVYASFGPSGVVAFTHDGELLWRQSVGTNTAGFGAASSPILFDDLLIMNASIEDGAVYGIDNYTGQVRWRTEGITKAWTTPTIVTLPSGEQEMVLNQKGAILGFDPRTGKQLWTCYGIQDYVVPCVVADGDTLYCSGGRSNMTVVVKAGGRGDVTNTHLVWDVNKGANVTSPLLHDGHLYWAHDKGTALCLRASDGEEMFRQRLPSRQRIYASIVSDGKQLFLTTRDSGVLVVAAEPEYRELALNKLGDDDELFNATPAVVGDQLLLRSDKAIYCVRRRQGT